MLIVYYEKKSNELKKQQIKQFVILRSLRRRILCVFFYTKDSSLSLRMTMNLLEKKSDFRIFYIVQLKHKVSDNRNQESPDIEKREASHGCWTAKAQMKVPQKRKLVDSFDERCNVKVVIQITYFYSVQQIAIRGANHFPMQASSHEECEIKDLLFARYIVL